MCTQNAASKAVCDTVVQKSVSRHSLGYTIYAVIRSVIQSISLLFVLLYSVSHCHSYGHAIYLIVILTVMPSTPSMRSQLAVAILSEINIAYAIDFIPNSFLAKKEPRITTTAD